MPNMNDFFDSKWLKADDLKGREVRTVISRIEVTKMNDGNKPVMFFEGKKKGVVLNKTNATRISNAYGDNMNDWIGKAVVIYPDTTTFNGQSVACIRVKVPAPQREPGEDPVDW